MNWFSMLKPRRPSLVSDTWTVYGRRVTGLGPAGVATTGAVHNEGFRSEAEAVVWLQSVILKHGGSVTAVIVKLREGKDANGYRTIVERVNGGKAWWE